MEKRKTLKEIAQEKGKHLFIESFSVTIPSTSIEVLTEGQRPLVESFQGEKFKAVAIVRNVPVTRFTENLNGRVYSKELWENVYRAKVAEGTLCLADHPGDDSDGSVKDIVGVWRNFKINESNCTADLYLVGKHGKHFLEVLQAGGKNGLSTVGFGELMEDERTVNPRTYELIRLSDWVLTPSQGVYAEQDNIDTNSVSMSESVKTKVESNTNIIEEKINQQERNHNMATEGVQALTVRNNVKVALKESERAKQNKGASLIEAKRDIEETLELIPESFGNERTKLVEEIASLDLMIKSEIKENTERLKVSEESISDLKEKAKTSDVMLTKIKEQLTKSKEVIKTISENEKILKTDLTALVEDSKLMENDITALMEDVKVARNDINGLISERGILLKDIRQALSEKLVMLEDIARLRKENKELKKENTTADTQTMVEDEIGQPDVLDIDLVQNSAYPDEDYGDIVDPMIAYRADDEDYGGVPWEDYNDESGYLESGKPAKQTIKESATKPKTINRDVLNFYNERVVKTPVLKKIKEGILAQPNLVQATKFIEKFFKQEDEKPLRISESRVNPGRYDWIGDNKY